MGYSAFDPVAIANVSTVKNKIDLSGATSDTISVGDVIRYDPTTDTYLRAIANSEAGANIVGIVEEINATNFVVVYSGEISLPDSVMSSISGYTGSQVFYLSDSNPGKLITTAPSNPGSIIKPVMITSGYAQDISGGGFRGYVDGIVVNTVGTRIMGDSQVDLSDIQPVGSVIAFSGATGQIPFGWSICDGDVLDKTTYSDLFTAIGDGKLYGFVHTATLTYVPGSGSRLLTQDTLVGTKFYITPGSIIDGIECTILSGTVSTDGTSVTNAEIQVNPLYVSGPNTGQNHNTYLSNGNQGRFYVETTEAAYTVGSVYTLSSVSNLPTKFNKPDLRSRFIIGESSGYTGSRNTAFGTYRLSTPGGEEYHTLTLPELPVHTHTVNAGVTLTGNVDVGHNLTARAAGDHRHLVVASQPTDGSPISAGSALAFMDAVGARWSYILQGRQDMEADRSRSSLAGNHSHIIDGQITVSTNNLTPQVSVVVQNSGSDIGHNNIPPYVVMYWIIKTRKDSYAKLYKLGPSGGGAVIAKNTAKRWLRAIGGVGCTVDYGAAYGTWGITRIAKGNYVFTHDLKFDLGTGGDSGSYIIEATIGQTNPGATSMCIANPYGYGGDTFGIKVYDVIGSTLSDAFAYFNVTVYGGGTGL